MVKKMKSGSTAGASDTATAAEKKSAAQLAGTVRESASQIWLAGLGAFAKAQEEGGKVFETLVKEGLSIQRKTQAVAEEKISEATNRMAGMATEISSKASGQWDKLESIFEDRVSKALNKLGVPSAQDIDALIARIDDLNRSVARLSAQQGGKTAPAAGGAAKAAKSAARKRPARKAAKTVTKTAAKSAARTSA